MITKTLLSTSLLANVVLLGMTIYLLKQEPSDMQLAAPVIVCTTHAQPTASPSQLTTLAPSDMNDVARALALSQATATNR
jgi:hypothetical protein